MGVDAEILVRKVPARIVTDEWLRRKSWDLCVAIGADKFFIQDGLMPEEYRACEKTWHEAFESHSQHSAYDEAYKIFNKDYTKRDEVNRIRDLICADIGQFDFKERRLAIEKTGTRYAEDGEVPGTIYRQDGDDIIADSGECLLNLNLWGRYYGPGYERGDIILYCAIAEWLEHNIPGCEVWYGGDSSGIEAKPFTEAYRRSLRFHLYGECGKDYWQSGMLPRDTPFPKSCSLCPNDRYAGVQCGWGNDYASFRCSGCDKRVETRDHGKTWQEKKDE